MLRRLLPAWVRALALAWFTALICAVIAFTLAPHLPALTLGVAIVVYVIALGVLWDDNRG